MTKCDFCTYLEPMKGCYWINLSSREEDCERAIKRMEAALASIGTAGQFISMTSQDKGVREQYVLD